jgi:hypothetical protein
MVSVIKIWPNHLVTIGWSNSYEATRLADKVDFVSYHFIMQSRILKENAILEKRWKKPVVIQEVWRAVL